MITLFVGKCRDGIHRQRPTYAVYGGSVCLEPAEEAIQESALCEKQEAARFSGTKRGRRGGRKHKRKV